MFCTKCGRELNDEWKVCPYCQTKVNVINQESYEENYAENVEVKTNNSQQKEFKFSGTRRTGRFKFKTIDSEAIVNGSDIKITTKDKKKSTEENFKKQNVISVSFPTIPVIGTMDIIRFIIFAVLIPFSYGMSIFGLILFVKFTLVKHARIQLSDGRKVKIPIQQKADMAPFLYEIGYSKDEVLKIEQSKVSERKLSLREWITTILLLILAAITIPFGMTMYVEDMQSAGTQADGVVKTLEEVGGFEGWKEEGYASVVRTSVVVSLPIENTDRNNYMVSLGDSPEDLIILIREDEASIKEWEWLQNAQPFSEKIESAYFDVTLTFLDEVDVDGASYPLFLFEDPEIYQGDELVAMQEEFTVEDYIKSCMVVDSAAVERDPEAYIGKDIIVEGYLGETLGVLTVGLWEGHGMIVNCDGDILYDVNLNPIKNIIAGDYGYVAGEFIGDGEINGKAVVVTASDDGVGGTDSALAMAGDASSGNIDTSLFEECVHDYGYMGNESGMYIYFSGVNGNKLDFYLADDLGVVNWYTATITSANTAVYENGDYVLLFEFSDFYSFSLTGEVNGYELSGTYYAMVG